MKLKLILALVTDEKTEIVTQTGRDAGATGCTVITAARGEGLNPPKTFFGLTLEGQRDVVLFIVEEHMSRAILEAISTAAGFDEVTGAGVAVQIDIEDAIGLSSQLEEIQREIEDKI
ncbi:MAG: P-II family nitrogen regulator [Alphaproteobacteria bacterium]|nr:P-II family nitrogen regulator [Alphaproteobacteria bacterium]